MLYDLFPKILLQVVPTQQEGQTIENYLVYVFLCAIAGLFWLHVNNQKKTLEMIEENFEKAIKSMETQSQAGLLAIENQRREDKTAWEKQFELFLSLHQKAIEAQLKMSESVTHLADQIEKNILRK